MFMGRLVEGKLETRRFQNRSPERVSKVKLSISPEEVSKQTCHHDFRVHTAEQVSCSVMSPTEAPVDLTGPWEKH